MSNSVLASQLSRILNYLLNKKGINEAKLSKAISLPKATVNRLVTGRTPDPRISTLQAIANYFDITVDQLTGNLPTLGSRHNLETIKTNFIPIFNWEDVEHWEKQLSQIKCDTHHDWTISDSETQSAKFALTVKGESMWPQFQENSVILIDVTQKPQNRDFVIVQLFKTGEALFRQLFTEGNMQVIKPINSIFPTIHMNENDKIIGVVIGTKSVFI